MVAVREVDLDVDAGTFVCIYGASGSGKTTLLNLIAGLDVPDSGTIELGDRAIHEFDEKQRAQLRLNTVGVVYQDHLLFDELTAVENVGLALEINGSSTRDAFEQGEVELSRVGLAGLGGRRPRELSGGQRQRVGIARALVGGRRVILADEPTGAIDSVASRSLFTLMRGLCDDGALIIVCTHDEMCREFADQVFSMVDGRLGVASSQPVLS